MRKLALPCGIAAATLVLVLASAPANAQATRTWVSGVGDDVNPCSRTAPCKTFAGAISKTAAGGEISVLDPGGFGAVTIIKSISIVQDSSGEGGILASSTNGVVISAGSTDIVNLRGLVIDGGTPVAPGIIGVKFLAGGALNIQNCVIKNFTAANGTGISFTPNASSKLLVRDTEISNNGTGSTGGGIVIKPTAGFASVTITKVNMDNGSNGLVADSTTTSGGLLITVRDSAASANGNTGIALIGGVGAAQSFMALTGVASSNNATGVSSSGANSTVLLSGSVITGNNTGLLPLSSGKIISYLNNVLLGNTAQGSPTSTQTGQ